MQSTYSITLDPGGFVVRDRAGQAVAVFASRFRAREYMLALYRGEQDRLFQPAPNVMRGQTTMGEITS